MKKAILIIIAAAAVILSAVLPLSADEDSIPSLFAGDDAWYKDSVAPLIIREGVSFIPADLLTMIDGISVTSPKSGSLLIHNTGNGKYISVLFSQRSAAVNGEIVEDISVFRNDGMIYMDAEFAAGGLGLTAETRSLPERGTILRITGENPAFTFDDLLAAYLPPAESAPEEGELAEIPDTEDEVTYDGKLKRIFVLVKSPLDGDATEFPALDNCRLYGVNYTHFLDIGDTVESVLTSSSLGAYGLNVTGAEDPAADAEELDDSFRKYTRRSAVFVLSTGDDETDRVMREKGLIPIRPDFTVNGTSNPDTLLPSIIQYIGSAGSCTLLLEDCWNSERMAILLSDLESALYCTANLFDYNFADMP